MFSMVLEDIFIWWQRFAASSDKNIQFSSTNAFGVGIGGGLSSPLVRAYILTFCLDYGRLVRVTGKTSIQQAILN